MLFGDGGIGDDGVSDVFVFDGFDVDGMEDENIFIMVLNKVIFEEDYGLV